MVPSFKAPPNGTLPCVHNLLNDMLSRPRVKSEHGFVLLKGRFRMLKNIRLQIGCKKDMERVARYVEGAVILHNLLIEDDYKDEWIEVGDDDNSVNGINLSTRINVGDDTDRRQQLLHYFANLFQ